MCRAKHELNGPRLKPHPSPNDLTTYLATRLWESPLSTVDLGSPGRCGARRFQGLDVVICFAVFWPKAIRETSSSSSWGNNSIGNFPMYLPTCGLFGPGWKALHPGPVNHQSISISCNLWRLRVRTELGPDDRQFFTDPNVHFLTGDLWGEYLKVDSERYPNQPPGH